MSHKVHPKIIKVKGIDDWLSRGFYHKNFPQYLEEDFKVREFLKEKLAKALVEDIEIERGRTSLKVIIKTARPALVIGRGGKGVEELIHQLKKLLKDVYESRKGRTRQTGDIKIEVLEVKNPWASAELTAQWVAGQIEKMVPFRRVLKMAVAKAKGQKEVKGVKVEVSGRLNGIEIARTEWLKEGRMPRQTFRSIIDYSFTEAYCKYGVIGVKVWIYKGERFE